MWFEQNRLPSRPVLAMTLALAMSSSPTLAQMNCLPDAMRAALDPALPVSAEETAAAPGSTTELPVSPGANTVDEAAAESHPLGVPDAIHVYFDASGSMVGYVRAPKTGPFPPVFTDLALSFPAMTGLMTESLFFYKFGERLVRIAPDALNSVASAAFYQCIGARGSDGCINQESRIADVLDRATRDRGDTLHVVITDLFLAQEDLIGSSAAALRRPLSSALRSGKMLGILALGAGFKGKIYDLPSGGTYGGAKGRPLFVLMIGDPDKVRSLVGAIRTDVLSTFPSIDHEFVQFSDQIVERRLSVAHEYDVKTGVGHRRQPDLVANVDRFPEIAFEGKPSPMTIEFDLKDVVRPDGLGVKGLSLNQTVWLGLDRGLDRGQCENDWALLESPPELATLAQAGMRVALKLFDDPTAMRALPKNRTYLSLFTVTADALDRSALTWVDDWSFSAVDEAKLVAKSPKFFPALNLSQLVDVFEAIAAQTFKPGPIAKVGIAFKPGV